MKKPISLIFFVGVISTVSFSQSNFHSVLQSQGGFEQNENLSLEWTLGENFVETVLFDNKILTQGFHQPITTQKLSLQNPIVSGNYTIYPNPVSSKILISTNNNSTFHVNLYDINWRIIMSGIFVANDKNISFDVSELPAGIYLLLISTDKHSEVETFKISKAN